MSKFKAAAEKEYPTKGYRKTEREPISEYQLQIQCQLSFIVGAEHGYKQGQDERDALRAEVEELKGKLAEALADLDGFEHGSL